MCDKDDMTMTPFAPEERSKTDGVCVAPSTLCSMADELTFAATLLISLSPSHLKCLILYQDPLMLLYRTLSLLMCSNIQTLITIALRT